MNKLAPRTTAYTAVDVPVADAYVDAHDGWSVSARYFHSRIHAITQQLRTVPRGTLLDLGCGPGVMLRHLAETRPGDFAMTGLDKSRAMVRAAEAQLASSTAAELITGHAEAMPFPDASFDVVLAMGVLEYSNVPKVVEEVGRVTRPGGLVLVTMLNPQSPYRLVEWCLYWPAVRLLGRLEGLLGVPAERRHDCARTGIRAWTAHRLQKALRSAGVEPYDLVYYDATPTVPPLDRVARKVNHRWRDHPDSTIRRGPSGVLGTAYLVAARKSA